MPRVSYYDSYKLIEEYARSWGLETARATAAHALTLGALYVHSPEAGGYKIQGDAFVNKTNRPVLRKTAIMAPISCATNWLRGFARRR